MLEPTLDEFIVQLPLLLVLQWNFIIPAGQTHGDGPKHQLVFVDRLLASLVHLRHRGTCDVLACWFGVDRSTVTRAIGETRPLLAE